MVNIELLENNPKVKLFIASEWELEFLMSIFLNYLI